MLVVPSPNYAPAIAALESATGALQGAMGAMSGASIIDGILYATSAGPSTRLIIDTYNSENAFGSSLRGRRARGTSGTPSGVLDGDVLLQLVGDGYNGTGFANAKASLVFAVAENWTPSGHGTTVSISTTPTGGLNQIKRIYVMSDGRVGVLNSRPQYSLDVSGDGNFLSGLYVNGVPVLTGAPTSSGVSIGQLDALSGWAASAANLMATGAGLHATLTGLSGQSVVDFATKAFVNGGNANLSGGLVATGSNLYALVTGLSGQANVNYATATNLLSTGQQAYNLLIGGDTNLSGNLTQTGVVLVARDTAISGGLEARLFQSGAASIAYATSVGTATSGSLALSGQQAWNAADSNGVNLSGALTQSGVVLLARDLATSGVLATSLVQTSSVLDGKVNALSGFVGGVSGALQTLIAGGGSVVRVTGSATIATVNLTGVGSVTASWIGGQVIISGAAGGGGVTQGQLDSLSGWAASDVKAMAISGTFATDLASTGQQAWAASQGNALNLSGSMVTMSGVLRRVSQFSVTMNSASVTWTAMPAAANYFNGTALYTTWVDLTNYTGVCLTVSKLATAGAATGALFLRYSSNPAHTFANYLDLTSPRMDTKVNVASVMINSGFAPIVAGAKSGVYVALCGSGGNASANPVFGMVTATFK